MQAGAADTAGFGHFDLGHFRAVEGENTLNTFAVGDLANGESLVQAAAFAGDDDAGENLDTFLVTFDDSGVNFDGVADIEGRHVLFDLLGFDFGDDVAHGDSQDNPFTSRFPGGAEPGKGRA